LSNEPKEITSNLNIISNASVGYNERYAGMQRFPLARILKMGYPNFYPWCPHITYLNLTS
jgi:hypothetical protein